MNLGLQITVADLDDDYLGLDIRASNTRFSGSTYIYAGLEELGQFAAHIAGFPSSPEDDRTYEFGKHDEIFAGGCCRLRFRCLDRAGHATIEIAIEDDKSYYTEASAQLSFGVVAADIDRFVERLRELQQERTGEATLQPTA